MDFSLTETQVAVHDLVRRILSETAGDAAVAAHDASGAAMMTAAWAALGEAELLGLAVPEAAGGAGLDLLASCSVLVEVGRAVAPVPALETMALGAWPVARLADDATAIELLSGVSEGSSILTTAWCDAASADPRRPATRAVPVAGGGYRISGNKTSVPYGPLARVVLVPATLGSGEVALFAVPRGTPGVRWEAQRGTNGVALGWMELVDAEVGPEAVVLTGDERLQAALDLARLGTAAVVLGVVERALELTASYTATRQQFGQPIAAFQAVAHRVADMYADVESLRVTLWQAAWRLDAGLPARRELTIAAWQAAESAHRVTTAAQHLHGGMGFDRDYPLHRCFLWAKQHEYTLGGSAALLAELGAAMAGGRALR
jgi:alkylation response protein AidB-like acyl-CoA dehydrogenase